jgi:hypothetical protein
MEDGLFGKWPGRNSPLFFTKNFLNSSAVLFFLAVSRKYMVNTKKFVGVFFP